MFLTVLVGVVDGTDFSRADDEVVSNDESLAAPTSSPVQPLLLLCTEVSYQLNKLSMTAQELLHEEGNTTFREGLEIAAATVVQEFLDSTHGNSTSSTTTTNATDQSRRRWLRNAKVQHQQKHLQKISLAYVKVTTVVDLPAALCTKPNCLVVTQHVCLYYIDNNDEEESDEHDTTAMQDGLRHALSQAIISGQLIQKVPPQYLPPS